MRTPGAFLPVALMATVGLLLAAPAQSQVIPSPYEFIDAAHDVEIFVGVAAEDRGSLELGPGGGPMLGARYGLRLTGPLTLEGAGYLISTDRIIWDPRATGGPEELGPHDTVIGGVDARVRFTLTGDRTWRGLAPHLIAGAGMAVDFSRRSSLEEDAELTNQDRFSFGPAFVAVAGAGTRWLPFDRLGFRLDASLRLWRLGTPPTFRGLEEELDRAIAEREWASVGTITAGASLRF